MKYGHSCTSACLQAPLMDSEILDLSGAGMDLDAAQYLRNHHHQSQQQPQHRQSCGFFSSSPTSPSRRESTMSSDSGVNMGGGGSISRKNSHLPDR